MLRCDRHGDPKEIKSLMMYAGLRLQKGPQITGTGSEGYHVTEEGGRNRCNESQVLSESKTAVLREDCSCSFAIFLKLPFA